MIPTESGRFLTYSKPWIFAPAILEDLEVGGLQEGDGRPLSVTVV